MARATRIVAPLRDAGDLSYPTTQRGDVLTIEELFAADGPLSALDGYQRRPAQIEYAQAVAEAIDARSPVLLEGPTGSGKSFGYLVPAIAHAVHEGARVAVVVPTKALQDQIAGKDLPDLQRVLPFEFEQVRLKGRSAYACRSVLDYLPPGRKWKALRDWAAEDEVGEISSSPLPAADQHRATISSQDCPSAGHCSFGQTCFVEMARARARTAQVVVMNSALFALGLRIGVATTRWSVIPEFDVLVVDEAHRFADTLREQWGTRLTERGLSSLAGLLPDADRGAGEALQREAQAFFRHVAEWDARRGGAPLVTEPVQVDASRLITALSRVADRTEEHAERLEADERAKTKRRVEVIEERIEALEDFLGVASESRLYTLEHWDGRSPVLVSKWLEVGPELQRLLEAADVGAQAYTSATMRVGGSFDWIRTDLGLSAPVDTHVAPSPFAAEQALRYVLPVDPYDVRWSDDAVSAVRSLVRAAGGGALLLCTARARMELMREACAGLGLNVLLHEGGEIGPLVSAFRDDHDSVLIASRSGFEGLDVPGEALRLVVVDRIPFPMPTDPIVNALGRIGRGWQEESLPRAAMALHQASGRLIRTPTDRGVIAVLDGRILTKRYGPQLFAPDTTDLSVAAGFFAEHRAG